MRQFNVNKRETWAERRKTIFQEENFFRAYIQYFGWADQYLTKNARY